MAFLRFKSLSAKQPAVPALVGVAILLMVALAAQQIGPDLLEQRERQDDESARAEWFMRGRRAYDGISPAEHMLRAVEQARAIPLVPARRLYPAQPTAFAPPLPTAGSWTELGPRPELDPVYGAVTGRVTGLAQDLKQDATGNLLYVGEAFGGVWKCSAALSGNPSCTPTMDGQPSLSIGAVAVDPTTAGVIYAATGEQNSAIDSYYGIGILKSINGGSTWQITSPCSGNTSVTCGTVNNLPTSMLGIAFSRILVDPTNAQVVLAAAGSSSDIGNDGLDNYYRGIYRSTNGGSSWTLAFAVTDNGTQPKGFTCTDMAYDASTATYYAAFRGHGFYKSTNQGATWTALPTPFANGVQPCWGCSPTFLSNFYRAEIATRSGTVYGVIVDSNGVLSTPTTCAGSSACDSGIVQSTSGGSSWNPVNGPSNLFGSNAQGPYDVFVAAPPSSNTLVVGGIDVWSTANVPASCASGACLHQTWTNLTNSYTGGTVHPDEHAIVASSGTNWVIGNDGGVWSTSNSGANWTNENATLGAIQLVGAAPDPATPGIFFGGSQDNSTAKMNSTTAPASWNWIWGGDGGYSASTISNGTAQYFTEDSGVSLARSDNAGSSFNSVVDNRTVPDFSAFYVPYQVIPASAGGTEQVALATCRMWIGPAVPNTSGAGWNPISPDLTGGGSGSGTCAGNGAYIASVAVAPSAVQTMYAATIDGRLAKTVNAADTSPVWSSIGSSIAATDSVTGLPIPWGAVATQPVNAGTIFVGRMGFGFGHVYKSRDGGATFTQMDGNLPDSPVNSIAVDPSHPSNVYVAQDAGVFVVSDSGNAGNAEVWQRLGGNLPAVAPLQLNFAPFWTSAPTIVAATHGRGAWSIPPLSTGSPEFSLSFNPQYSTVLTGQSATIALSATWYDAPTPATITLSGCSVIHADASTAACSVTPGTLTPAANSASISVPSASLASGPNSVSITATDGTNTHVEAAIVAFTPPGISISGSPTTQSVTAGGSASYNLTIGSIAGFSGTVALSCSGTAAATTCSVSPTSVSVTGTTNGTATLSVVTTKRSSVPPMPEWPAWPNAGLLAAMLFALLAVAMIATRRRTSVRAALACGFVAAILFVSVSCGKGKVNGTPAGTYSIVVTGKSGSTTGQGSVTLTVN